MVRHLVQQANSLTPQPLALATALPHVRVHLTNVTATGATRVAQSLLPALENDPGAVIDDIYLPDTGELAGYACVTPEPTLHRYRRHLPNVLSRLLECTLQGALTRDPRPILVLGDIPLRCEGRQIVFVQSPHMTPGSRHETWRTAFKYSFARQLFRLNSGRVSAVVVQSEGMKVLMEESYPRIQGKVVVIPQPAPSFVLDSGLRRTGRLAQVTAPLDLFYPATAYAHKNHAFLRRVRASDATDWPVANLTLTIPESANPNRRVPWIDCVGFLSPESVLDVYGKTDAVVFLSTAESYGLPIVEAMHIGLPIIAPNLPYARWLCGDEAIYFDVDHIESLRLAIIELQRRLAEGWWPNWSEHATRLPRSWSCVARQFLQVLTDGA